MTKRQAEALEWLDSVGKASVRLVRRKGFSQATFDALYAKGLVERYYLPGPRPSGPVYRSKRP